MPGIAGNMRFSREKTFPTGRLMTGMQQKATFLVFAGRSQMSIFGHSCIAEIVVLSTNGKVMRHQYY
jgi:hypothetical protein